MKVPTPELKKARIEIIPMIDTIFFLLVFFMVSSLSMIKMKAINVSLPMANAPAPVTPISTSASPSTLIATVTDGGEFFLNKEKVTRATLTQMIQASVNANPKAVVVVNVAKSQTTQSLINVMDACNKVTTPNGGPVPLLIATEPVTTTGAALPGNPTSTGAPRAAP